MRTTNASYVEVDRHVAIIACTYTTPAATRSRSKTLVLRGTKLELEQNASTARVDRGDLRPRSRLTGDFAPTSPRKSSWTACSFYCV